MLFHFCDIQLIYEMIYHGCQSNLQQKYKKNENYSLDFVIYEFMLLQEGQEKLTDEGERLIIMYVCLCSALFH